VNSRPGGLPASQVPGRLRPRSFALAAVAVAALTAAAPATSAGPPDMGLGGRFGLAPAPGSHGQGGLYFQLAVAPGHSARAAVIVTNLEAKTQVLKIGRSVGVTAANGGSTYIALRNGCAGPACWVSGLPSLVTLPAHTQERLNFTVTVPVDTANGQYLGGISAGSEVASPSVNVGSSRRQSTRAVIVQDVTVGVAVTVGKLSSLVTRFRIADVKGAIEGPMARLSIQLYNTGQTFAHAAGTVSCTAAGSQHSYAVNANTILPHDQAQIAVNAPGLPEGATLPCKVSLSYGSHQTVSWAGTVRIPGASDTRVIHTANGAYTVIPKGGVPPWAAALIGIGVLMLAGIGAVLLRPLLTRQRRRRTS
jgi:Bacterial protein of unknown function (DUF916)